MIINKNLNLSLFYKLFIILGLIISITSIYFKDYQTVFYESELEQLYSYLFINEYLRPYLTNHPWTNILYYFSYLKIIQSRTS